MQPSPPNGEASRSGRRIGRPSRRVCGSSSYQSAPSGDDTPHVECSPRRPHDMLSETRRREDSPGHMGYMRALRRSAPFAGWELGDNLGLDSAVQTPRAPSEGIRIHRVRRAADFGANLGMSNVSRSRSVSGVAQASFQLDDPGLVPSSTDARLERGDSMPPTGSTKVDTVADERTRAQARAIAALQKMFFEEMAGGAQDANSAAVVALRRLSEATQDRGTFAPTSTNAQMTNADTAFAHQVSNSVMCGPFAPRRPSPTDITRSPQHRRRPTRIMRVAVQS